MSKIYLEISGKGQGKTYRLINAIMEYLRDNPLKKCYLFAGALRVSNFIKRQVERQGYFFIQRIIQADLAHPNNVKGKRFFDNFEYYLADYLDFIPLEGDYYCSSPIKRSIEQFIFNSDQDDILYKLLKFNNGQYVSYLDLILVEPDLLEEVKNESNFKSEYLGQFLE